MNTNFFKLFALIACVALSGDVAQAQRSVRSARDASTLAEITVLKRKAEAGNRDAQLALGLTLAGRSRGADALDWYRKAAAQSSVEATWLAGEMLLLGKPSNEDSQRVIARPDEGLLMIYSAATNRHAMAARSMSVALQRGLGVRTNVVEAYAWLRLFAEVDPSRRKRELDSLGITLSLAQLDQADQLVRAAHRGQWPPLQICREYKKDSRLKLSGVTVGGSFPLAIINRRTLAEGESANIPTDAGSVNVKCLKIADDFVLVTVDQDPEPRRISLY